MKKYLYYGMGCMLVLASCAQSASHSHEADEHSEEAGHQHPANEIVMSHEMIEAAGIETWGVQPGTFAEVLKTSGQILAAQGEDVTVVAPVSGVVSFMGRLSEGTLLNARGEILSISSGQLQEGSQTERVKIAYETAKSDFDRASRLVEKQIITRKDFNAIREKYENARLAYDALSVGEDGENTHVKSPFQGYVKSLAVNEGDFVSVGQPLLVVSMNRRLQLRAEVSERYFSSLGNIVSANFTTPYDDKVYSLNRLDGKRIAYGKSTNGTSYYIPVTFEFNNVGDVIPGSYVEVYLLGTRRDNVISLPKTAVVEEQGLNFVYIKVVEHGFVRREVKLGLSDGERYEVLSGIRSGEEVVVKGAIHVKLASAAHTIPGHTHNH